ncbi:hypothetical protein ACFPK1_32885 [Actinomycetospora rhizophila]|uniref:Uncharacterized protein n=1 Tax=Actinomycetospora rhizophila TaxID=1416876 RepID=A0ABV9ZS77_9PSEU
MVVGTRWWRRTDAELGAEDVWGGPDEVTLAPAPRDSPDDLGRDAREKAEREAREQAEQEARETAEREVREQAEREAREQAEREARETAEREAREQAEREAREQAKRDAREQAEREAREQAEREAREQAEREAREQAEREAREQAEREAREQAEREAREQAERDAREQAEREAREREAREQAEREAREQAEREAREREAREQAEQERVATLPGEAVSPSVARAAASRDEAARKAAKADRKRRRRRVLLIFLIALVAVAAVWIVPRLIALALAIVTALGGTVAADAPATPVAAASAAGAAPAAAPAPRQELPRGGTTIAPEHRVVVLRAAPGVAPAETADRVESTATAFGTTDRDALPAVELPVGAAGADGAAWQQLALTRAHRQLLVLAVPTGPAGVVAAIEPWERLLREPDVGLALDTTTPTAPTAPLPPEQLDAATRWLAEVVRSANLPQKLLVVPGTAGAAPPEVALVSTGGATPPALRGTVLPLGGPGAREVLAAQPAPDVVLYR